MKSNFIYMGSRMQCESRQTETHFTSSNITTINHFKTLNITKYKDISGPIAQGAGGVGTTDILFCFLPLNGNSTSHWSTHTTAIPINITMTIIYYIAFDYRAVISDNPNLSVSLPLSLSSILPQSLLFCSK
jgi:hypothetical protein